EKEEKLRYEEKKNQYNTCGLSIINVENLKLKNGEVCHFAGSARICVSKIETVGYESGGGGVSVGITRDVSVGIGGRKGQYVKDEVTEKTQGMIYLTSDRLIFSAIRNSCVIKYKDIINLSNIDKMVQMQTEDKGFLFEVDDLLDFMLVLEFIINKNEDNGNDKLTSD
ncbi:MAG: hypothetical protein IKC64_05035, partial [Clostridia bacterium]|nr:hypothetical protein [Clostridia bacterium]